MYLICVDEIRTYRELLINRFVIGER